MWTDGANRKFFNILADGSNYLYVRKFSGNNTVQVYYTAGATAKSVSVGSQSSILNRLYTVTWDKSAGASGEVKFYINGAQAGATQTGLGVWAGSPATSIVGATNTAPAQVTDGLLAHAYLRNRAETPAEVLRIAQAGGVA